MSPFASWQVARRAAQAQVAFVLAFALLGAAFFKAQVIDHGTYRSESERNRLRPIPLEAPRGDILDRNGKPIAENVAGYSVKLLATREDSLRAVLARLDALVTDDTIDADKVVRRWKLAKYEPALVYASGRYDVVARLEEHRTLLPGLVIQQEPRRLYPDSSAVAHLTGYVGEVSSSELESNAFPGAEPGSIVGKQGLELSYDSILRGRTGVRFVEVTAANQMVRDQADIVSLPPTPGRSIRTTIDLDLQRFVDSMWRADLSTHRGALVAMTPEGEILAYYSYPTFDPNDFIGRIDPETWNALRNDPDQPLYNRVIQGAYPPGSPFKLAIAAMALRRGIVTMDSRMREPCTGSYRFGNRVWHCWDPRGHGSLTLRQAIAASCDIYFYQLGQLLGADSILADATEWGFGERAGIDLGLEGKGVILPSVKAYVNSHGVSTWGNGETLNLAIGQGRHTETLLNMVSFYAAMASDGIKREPRLLAGPPGPVTHDLHLTPAELNDLRLAMVDVVNSGTATGNLAGEAGIKEIQVAGKTGSAQVTGAQPLAWFIAFAPAAAPKIVVGIAVEEGVHGNLVAKYPVRTIMRYLTGKSTRADVNDVSGTLPAVPDVVGQPATPPPPAIRP